MFLMLTYYKHLPIGAKEDLIIFEILQTIKKEVWIIDRKHYKFIKYFKDDFVRYINYYSDGL
jgi:hypothetical protein